MCVPPPFLSLFLRQNRTEERKSGTKLTGRGQKKLDSDSLDRIKLGECAERWTGKEWGLMPRLVMSSRCVKQVCQMSWKERRGDLSPHKTIHIQNPEPMMLCTDIIIIIWKCCFCVHFSCVGLAHRKHTLKSPSKVKYWQLSTEVLETNGEKH